MKQRTYTEEEMAALLERAAELQAQSSRSASETGLTLAELESVAAEAGLDPAFLRRAAAEMEEPRPLARSQTGTSATHVYVERWMEGGLSVDVWEDVVMELRHRFDTDMGKLMGMPDQGVSSTEQIGRMVVAL